MARVLTMAVFPCRIRSPIPKRFLPKAQSNKAKQWLYPSEEADSLACSAVPFERRILYGFLTREAMRISEALALRWGDLDLERGLVRLDENKTDDPRAWALNPSVARALKYYKRSTCKPSDLVFQPLPGNKNAEVLRTDLQTAGVTRPELFESSKARLPLRLHDLRGTFVTLALANGRTEGWVQDRTGHKSSQMINRYRRAARTAAKVAVGDLAPLDSACPEFRGPKLPGQTWPEIWPKALEATPSDPAKIQ